eukprot:CAMPEP_0194373802 /NCGR_PEP_ID=MMETSP0174-20130528/22237_1 /TAXON_ID=216777 /ORGANISM="Proboscia alata, Strain PI-D3" /LENGTH=115 /DNA_ID=CAMNT_0039153065 /DNA_START=37 /DNA_END=381 /DNA_ORIENTATION=-
MPPPSLKVSQKQNYQSSSNSSETSKVPQKQKYQCSNSSETSSVSVGHSSVSIIEPTHIQYNKSRGNDSFSTLGQHSASGSTYSTPLPSALPGTPHPQQPKSNKRDSSGRHGSGQQ